MRQPSQSDILNYLFNQNRQQLTNQNQQAVNHLQPQAVYQLSQQSTPTTSVLYDINNLPLNGQASVRYDYTNSANVEEPKGIFDVTYKDIYGNLLQGQNTMTGPQSR
jgi:hypothetical protein